MQYKDDYRNQVSSDTFMKTKSIWKRVQEELLVKMGKSLHIRTEIRKDLDDTRNREKGYESLLTQGRISGLDKK